MILISKIKPSTPYFKNSLGEKRPGVPTNSQYCAWVAGNRNTVHYPYWRCLKCFDNVKNNRYAAKMLHYLLFSRRWTHAELCFCVIQ